jgi:SagB-type dehydrogenase family enzyme
MIMNPFISLRIALIFPMFLTVSLNACSQATINGSKVKEEMKEIILPSPDLENSFPLTNALMQRRSVRNFTNQPISLQNLSQLMWAAQGITEPDRGFRTAPSAGATFPAEIYLVASRVHEVEKGLYHYKIGKHILVQVSGGDLLQPLPESALMQEWLSEAAAIILICADFGRTTARYGERGIRYVHMETGHIGQNIALQAVALNLGTTMVGAFYDDQLSKVLNLPSNHEPLYIIPVGHPK